MQHALYLLGLQSLVFLTGYAWGRVRLLHRFFGREAPDSDDPHIATVHDLEGKPVSVFNPRGS